MLENAYIARYALFLVTLPGESLFYSLPHKYAVMVENISSEVDSSLCPVPAKWKDLSFVVAKQAKDVPQKVHDAPLPLMYQRFVLAQ